MSDRKKYENSPKSNSPKFEVPVSNLIFPIKTRYTK